MNLPLQDLQNRHLSEEALDDLLLGAGSAADEHHLAMCAVCSGRLAEFRTSLAIFNQASAAWSHARSNGISRELTPRAASHAAAAWSLACMTILAAAISLTSHLHRSPDLAAAGANEHVLEQAVSGEEEIASDNAMLAAIDSKLSEPVHSPVVAYGSESVAPAPRRAARSEVRD